ncbi:MAG TPA: hypothetical protein VII22_20085 [Streptosporangiaceae bacterium]
MGAREYLAASVDTSPGTSPRVLLRHLADGRKHIVALLAALECRCDSDDCPVGRPGRRATGEDSWHG